MSAPTYSEKRLTSTYAAAHGRVTTQIRLLSKLLKTHATDGPRDWGYVGDLTRLHALLREAIEAVQ